MVEIVATEKIVIATLIGDVDESTYLGAREKVKEMLLERNLNRTLIDLRNAALKMPSMTIYGIASSHTEVIPLGTKYAIAYSKKTCAAEDVKFGENAACNRGAVLRAFTDLDEAKRWLHE